MNRHTFGTLRRLDLLLVAAAVGSATLVPTLAGGQAGGQQPGSGGNTANQTQTGSGGQDKQGAQGNQARRNRNQRNTRATTRSTDLSIVPVGTTAGQATTQAPAAPQLPPGAKIQPGPDGKPMVVGADGKPLMGPDGKPFPVPAANVAPAQTGTPTRKPNMFDSLVPTTGGGQTGGFGGNGIGRNTFGDLTAGGTITMDFRGSDIQNVLKFFAMATNWQIVPDPTLTGPVTIISPKPLTIDQAFQVLQSTLEIRGFSGQLEKRGDTTILRIVPFDRAVQTGNNVLGTDEKGNATGPLTPDQLKNLKGQVITQVIPVENVDAAALARELKELTNKGASLVASTGTNALIVTDTASNVQRISELVRMLDKAASSSQIQIFALQHSDATDVTNVINNLFGQVYGRGRGGGRGPNGQPGQPQPVPQPGQPGQPGAVPEQNRGAILATPDTRTNSVIVVASEDNIRKVADLIQRLDDPAASALDTKIVKMQYADALDIADTINSILSNSTVPSTGNNRAASFQSRVFGGAGFGGFGGGGQQAGGVTSTDPFAKVVGNARTNSLIVTATKEKMEKIDELIRELDVPVAIESTTFVIPLKNAQAQDIATILGQAFGTSNTGGGFGGGVNIFGGFGGNNNNQRRSGIQGAGSINRRTGSGTGTTGGFGRSVQMSPSSSIDDPAGVPGTLTPDGQFVPAAAALQQAAQSRAAQFFPGGGGFGGFGRGGGGQMQTPMYGRGSNGQYANLSQLRQNVGVVADPATNSLVITTTPDNLPILKQIIESLDVIPRQVMIEVIIAEASLDTSQKLGVQFDAQGVGKILGSAGTQTTNSNFPLGSSGSALSNINGPLNPGIQFGVSALSGRYHALIQALATDSRVRILSTPKVFTSNNQTGLIDVTTSVPYVTGATQNSLISTGTNITTSFLDVGIQLQVTPRIARDGLVTIDVVTSASELLSFDTLTASLDANGRPQTIVAPRTSQRDTDTEVTVRDGEVVVLGGLMRDNITTTVNKVPLLGDIPIIGHLFRSTSHDKQKTELMVFLIPHVVDNDATNRKMVDEQSKNIRKAFPDLEKDHPALKPTTPGTETNKAAEPKPVPPPNPEKPLNPANPNGAPPQGKTTRTDTKPADRSGFDK